LILRRLRDRLVGARISDIRCLNFGFLNIGLLNVDLSNIGFWFGVFTRRVGIGLGEGCADFFAPGGGAEDVDVFVLGQVNGLEEGLA
jgi:hypothetical protein